MIIRSIIPPGLLSTRIYQKYSNGEKPVEGCTPLHDHQQRTIGEKKESSKDTGGKQEKGNIKTQGDQKG